MQATGKVLNTWVRLLLALTLILGIAGCDVANIFSGTEPLPAIPLLPSPQIPDWIEQVSPTGEAENLAQIRIRFQEPLIPIESLDSPQQQQKLQQFEILPPLPGRFRFLTPRMVGFQADKALPKATRIQVTLKSGLEDLKNHQLKQDLAWTFSTQPIQLTNLPKIKMGNDYTDSFDLKPTLNFTSNVELDLNSLSAHVQLIPEGKNKSVPLQVKLQAEPESTIPIARFADARRYWEYTVLPRQELKTATRYKLEISPGLLPVGGNRPSEVAFNGEVETYYPLQFKGIEYLGQERFVQGGAQLKFTNGLVAESAIENITIKPAPQEDIQFIQAYPDSNTVAINPWALEPDTNYTITINPELQDKFGQTLGKPIEVKYKTGNLTANIDAPSGLSILPTTKDLQLNIANVNLPESKYQAVYRKMQPTDLVYINVPLLASKENNFLPAPATWKSFTVKANKNQINNISLPLQQELGAATGLLAYGIQARTTRYQQNQKQQWREPKFYGMAQLTNLGIFSQWFPDSGLIRVNHLDDGSAVASASVAIYQSQLGAKSRPQPKPCATGKTDQNGTLVLNENKLRQCIRGSKNNDSELRFTEPPELLVIARQNQDWAFARIQQYSGAYGYGIYPRWDGGKPQSRGTIFSDRKLYQPGEKAEFTGVAYYLQNGIIKQDKNAQYQVTLRSPDGKSTNLGTQTTNEFGTFSLELPLQENQALGFYWLRAQGENGIEIAGQFRVAEFKPPNFNVELSFAQEFALINQQVEAIAASNYLFGTPVAGARANYYVTRQPVNFSPKGWDEFSFGRQWLWPEKMPDVPSEVKQENIVLDQEGKGSISLSIDDDLPYPMTYRIDAEVVDVSNLAVADSKTFTALPSSRLIGLRTKFIAEANQAFPVEVIVTEPTGKVIRGESVRLELQKINYSRNQKAVVDSIDSQDQVEYETVAQAEVKSGNKTKTVSLKAPEAGFYRLRANFKNAKNEITASDERIWVTGDDAVIWEPRNNRQNYLKIKLDKQIYQPGETATALIESPYPEAQLYFAVVRDQVIYQTIQQVKGGAPQIQFPITAQMLPNVAVQAVLVRQGEPLEKLATGNLEDLVQIGFVPLEISLQDKYLQVEVTPDQAQIEPGKEQTLKLELKDNQGKPVKGQFSVMVVNEDVLQLTGYRPPDLVETVYTQQPIATSFSDNRFDILLESIPISDRRSYPLSQLITAGTRGGNLFSASAGDIELKTAAMPESLPSTGAPSVLSDQSNAEIEAAKINIRKDFRPLAYYNGSVITDRKGEAKVNFKLPDNLTTWRVIAVATTEDMRFGDGNSTFVTAKPLLSNPLLPQFVRPGDLFQAGVSVSNNTGKQGNLEIKGSLSEHLQFTEKSQNTTILKTKAESGTRAYRFPVLVASIGEGKVQFVAQLNKRQGDGWEVPLVVQSPVVTEQVVETGTTDKQVEIPLNVNNQVVPEVGGLQISLASTLIPEMTAPAQQVLEDDTLPFLEPAASQLVIAANLQILSQKYAQTFAEFNPTRQAVIALNQLQKLQQADGGFAFWSGQKRSAPLASAYAAQAIAQASTAFTEVEELAALQINSEMVSRLQSYLQKILANPKQNSLCPEQRCQHRVQLSALMALAEIGEKRDDFLKEIYQHHNQFEQLTQIKLARYLSDFPGWQQQAQELFNQLQETIYETGSSAQVNLPRDWRWLNSPSVTQAQALRLFITQNSKPEILDKLLQGLLDLRRKGTWQTSYNNAEALTALVEYSQLQPTPPNFTATAKLAGKTLGSAQFEGYRNPSLELKIPMNQLPTGSQNLNLETAGQGRLHYLVAYRYRLQGNQPGRFNGLRITRSIRQANQEEVERRIGLYSADEPLRLKSGKVFDIGLEIISDHPVEHVVISDPLPAGLEAIDANFQTSTPYFQAQADSWEIGYEKIYRDRLVAYSDRLQAGVYSLHYLVRSVTPGKFEWPGAEVYLQYAPEEFGRSASSQLEVVEKN
ncbi:MAG: alpha-2-macroglobulin family protein [Symploca sp. SIO2B6]|nr:alpha-2-macroglobulin family protein [Symploca sp. SIO2B6]